MEPLFPEKTTFKNPIRVNDLFIIRNRDWGLLLKKFLKKVINYNTTLL